MALSKEQIIAIADELDAEGIKPTLANVRKRIGSGSYTTISEVMNEWHNQRKESESTVKEPAPKRITDRLEDFGTELWNLALDISSARLQTEKDEMELIQKDLELKHNETAEMADQLATENDTLRQEINKLKHELLVSKESESSLKESLNEEVSRNTHLTERWNASEEIVRTWQLKFEQLQKDLSESNKENTKLTKELTRIQVNAENKENDLKETKKENKDLSKQLSACQVENGKLNGMIEALRDQLNEKNELINSAVKNNDKEKTD